MTWKPEDRNPKAERTPKAEIRIVDAALAVPSHRRDQMRISGSRNAPFRRQQAALPPEGGVLAMGSNVSTLPVFGFRVSPFFRISDFGLRVYQHAR
jgi:hypothetical protein